MAFEPDEIQKLAYAIDILTAKVAALEGYISAMPNAEGVAREEAKAFAAKLVGEPIRRIGPHDALKLADVAHQEIDRVFGAACQIRDAVARSKGADLPPSQ